MHVHVHVMCKIGKGRQVHKVVMAIAPTSEVLQAHSLVLTVALRTGAMRPALCSRSAGSVNPARSSHLGSPWSPR
jgi:hypothetical protein